MPAGAKQTNYEIDTNAPLIVRKPGARGNGQSTRALVEFVDIYPTLCEIAGLPIPGDLEGRSFAAVLENPEQPHKDAAFSQFLRRYQGGEYMGYAMRTDRYRFIEWINRETGDVVARELYDHAVDPQENTSIAERRPTAYSSKRSAARCGADSHGPRRPGRAPRVESVKRSLAASTGNLTDVTRHQVSRQPRGQFLDEPQSCRFLDFKVSGSGHAVKLVQVIGNDAEIAERFREARERFRRVVHTTQQDRLVQRWNPGLDKAPQSVRAVVLDLAGMIGMNDHDRLQA